MNIETLYHAKLPGGDPSEGLVASLVDGDRLAVQIRLEGRTRQITLDRSAATRFADSILTGISERFTLSEDASLAAKSAPEGAAAQIEPDLRAAFTRMSSEARDSLRRHDADLEARRFIAEALGHVDTDLVLALAVDMSAELLEELAHEPNYGLSSSPGHPHYRGRL